MRSNYWNCTKFADWLRGTPKGGAKTSGGWQEWSENAKQERPIRYWLAEEGLVYLQEFVMYPYDVYRRIRRYVKNRWVYRSNALVAKRHHVTPGQWCDLTARFMYCPFDALVDFVEIECAHIQQSAARAKRRRSRHDGLAYLEWQIRTESDYKELAAAAREIKELYLWWVDQYANRKDPWDIVGLNAYYETLEKKYGPKYNILSQKTEEEQEELDKLFQMYHDFAREQLEEEDAMLQRLMKVRHYLWT